MTIKSELKAKLQQTKVKQEEEKRDLENKAREFILEFIIPMFRKISEEKPTLEYLSIIFYNGFNRNSYTSSLKNNDWIYEKDSPYDYSVISKAVKLAAEYDIEASEKVDASGSRYLTFYLDLS